MTRPIEFRVWNPNRKKMSDSYELPDRTLCQLLKEIDMSGLMPIPLQFTGLLDRNGNKIFEGDILKFEESGEEEPLISISIVYWCTHMGAWALKDDTSADLFANVTISEHEIIGNIYENPELIEL